MIACVMTTIGCQVSSAPSTPYVFPYNLNDTLNPAAKSAFFMGPREVGSRDDSATGCCAHADPIFTIASDRPRPKVKGAIQAGGERACGRAEARTVRHDRSKTTLISGRHRDKRARPAAMTAHRCSDTDSSTGRLSPVALRQDTAVCWSLDDLLRWFGSSESECLALRAESLPCARHGVGNLRDLKSQDVPLNQKRPSKP